MTNKRKKRVRALSERTGMSYQAASNALAPKASGKSIEDIGLLGFFRGDPILTREAIYEGGRHWLRLHVRRPDGEVGMGIHTLSVNEDAPETKAPSFFDVELPLSAVNLSKEQRVVYEVAYTRMMFEAEERGEPKPLHETTIETTEELQGLYELWTSPALNLPVWQRARPRERLCGVEFGGRVVWFGLTLLKQNAIEGFGEWYLALPKGEAVFDEVPRRSVSPSKS